MHKITNILIKYPESQTNVNEGIWTIMNLVRGKPAPQWEHIAVGFPLFQYYITGNHSEEVVSNALWAISYASGTFISSKQFC